MQDYCNNAPGKTPEEVAETLVWMATAPETGLPGSRHFYDMQQLPILPHARDDAAAARLWEESERILTGLGY
jgi:hypothetical protein